MNNNFLIKNIFKSCLNEIEYADSPKFEYSFKDYYDIISNKYNKTDKYLTFDIYHTSDSVRKNELDYFLDPIEKVLVYINGHFSNNKSFIETLVAKNPNYTNIHASDILLNYYLPKYSSLRSDFQMSDDGCHYWVSVMQKAANKNFIIKLNIEIIDSSKTNLNYGENIINNDKIKITSHNKLYNIIRENQTKDLGYRVEDITIEH